MPRRLTLLDTYHLLRDGEPVAYEHCATGEVQEAHSPDDFPYLLANELRKRLLDVYKEMPSPWREYCAIGSTGKLNVTEYDITPSLMHGDLETNETGVEEIDETTILEHRTGRLVQERKRGFVIPRSVIVNDDLDFFSKVGGRLASMASRTLNKAVVTLLETPGNAWDGTAFFHADHGNLIDSADNNAPWYLVAAPNVIPALQVSFLNGVEQPAILMAKPEMASVVGGVDDPYDYQFDDLRFKARFDFGVNISQYQAILKSDANLTIANVKTAIRTFHAMTDETGELIDVNPAILLCGPSNYFGALEIAQSTEIELAGSTDAERGNKNVVAGMVRPVLDKRLTTTGGV